MSKKVGNNINRPAIQIQSIVGQDEKVEQIPGQVHSEKWYELQIATANLNAEKERTEQGKEKTRLMEIEGRDKKILEEEKTRQMVIEGRDKIRLEQERTKQEKERTIQAANRNAAIPNQKPLTQFELKTAQSGLSTSELEQSQSSIQFKFLQKLKGLLWGAPFYWSQQVYQPSIYEGLDPVKNNQTKIKQD